MYIVIELQANNEGQVANIVTAYDTLAQAWNKFFTICAAAAISEVPIHSAVILDIRGMCVAQRSFEHAAAEPEVEPVEEVTENE